MSSSRYDDSEREGIEIRKDIYRGQRAPISGLINALLALGPGDPSLLRRKEVGTARFVGYLAYQVPCALPIPVVPVSLLILLCN